MINAQRNLQLKVTYYLFIYENLPYLFISQLHLKKVKQIQECFFLLSET